MNIFNIFKETTEVSKEESEKKPEFSQEMQKKLEELMGDDELPDTSSVEKPSERSEIEVGTLEEFSETNFEDIPDILQEMQKKLEELMGDDELTDTLSVEKPSDRSEVEVGTLEELTEISQDAQSKFDKIMGDEELPKASIIADTQNRENILLDILNKVLNPTIPAPKIPVQRVAKDEATVKENREEELDNKDVPYQPHEPNSEYKEGDDLYETDDEGKTYKKNGELLPNTEYTVNGNTYRTNENGNIVSCDAKPEMRDEGKRNTTEQRESGGEDRKEGDQGGHIIARILGGAEGQENLVPMRGTINQGDYKKMENEIKEALEEGKQVNVHIDIEYDGASSRPTKIMATYTIDGKKTEMIFDNEENSTDLLDTLDTKLSDEDFAQLKEEIDDMKNDGCPVSITSVKTEYDESGNVTKVIVGVLDESTGTKSYKVYDAQ